MTAPMWPDLTASLRAAHEAQEDRVLRSPTGEAAKAERERLEAAAADEAARPPRERPRAPQSALRLPERAPGALAMAGVAVTGALRGLYAALHRHTRGWPAKRRARLERCLVELEEALR